MIKVIKFRAWDTKEARFLTKRDPLWCITPEGKFAWWDSSEGWEESNDCEIHLRFSFEESIPVIKEGK